MLSNRLKDTGIQSRADIDALEVTTADHTSQLAQVAQYPFQPRATFTNQAAWLEITNAVKRIELIGADPTVRYALGIIQRAHATYGTGIYIYSCDVNGNANTIVSYKSNTGYAEPTGIDVFQVNEYQKSGVSAIVYVDWTKITSGAQYVNTHYDKSGLNGLVVFNDKPLIILPDKIYGVVGQEINVYFDNVLFCENPEHYQIDCICTVGTQQAERWTYTPSVTTAYTLTINVYEFGKILVAYASTTITIAAAAAGTGANRKCLFIGDSLTSAAVYTGELVTLFGGGDPMDITLLGTLGTAPNLHEGRAGWTASNYVSNADVGGVTNPFYNSGFDFSKYMTDNSYVAVDSVFVMLGINDVFSYTSDATVKAEIANIITRYNAIIASIHAFSATAKVGIAITVPPSKSQDAFGKNYTSGQNRWRYRRNVMLLAKALIENYKARTAEYIYTVPISTNLDTVNNMQTETVAVNSRNATTVVRQANGVHPATDGYEQIADVYYYFLKYYA